MLTANEIRKSFLDFFSSKGHRIVASDTLVPKDDPTVLFTTAGMQQFKRQFLGQIGDFTRAATSQKCLRTDDLDQVGKTPFHHTFFEMLGNFSFGDYFKQEAIAWAWEYLTQILKIPADKLWVSVYQEDQEAEDIWIKNIKLPPGRLVRLGDKSNFWPSEAKLKGPNGPCGPCSEIFYDYGVNPNCQKKTKCDPACECGRFAEIWNLVFTQFNRKEGGILEPLPAKNIDTGMGLERLVAVVQGKRNNFETDLFNSVLKTIDEEINKKIPLREKYVIADHVRAIVFSINDGVIPSNKERGYVVKGLINNATNIALSHDAKKPTIYKLVPVVAKIMNRPYPEITAKVKDISEIIRKFEEAFIQVLEQRIPILKVDLQNAKPEELGGIFFKYRDTYGLPLAVITGTAGTLGLSHDAIQQGENDFRKNMFEQQERSRQASKMTGDVFVNADLDLKGMKTIFLGYETIKSESRILKIFQGDQEISQASQGDQVRIVLDQTPFYAESGGQVGDKGMILSPSGKIRVIDTQKVSDVFLHVGEVCEGSIKTDTQVQAEIDNKYRSDIMRNHTTTHLLQAALRQVLGKHVQQQGSIVDAERLRFDFTHPKALTPQETEAIEKYVYAAILSCQPVKKETLSLEEAKAKGALAFFAEKYDQMVRVISIPNYSQELCGGTHLNCTGEIGLFKIVSESSIAQGIRRIEAVTGWGAYNLIAQEEQLLNQVSALFKVAPQELVSRLKSQTARIKQLEKELEQWRFQDIKNSLDKIIAAAEIINGSAIITTSFGHAEINLLRLISDVFKEKLKSAIVVLGSQCEGNGYLLTVVTDDLIKRGIRANELINTLAPMINGSGGGRPQLAQAGTREPKKIEQALEQARLLAKEKLQK